MNIFITGGAGFIGSNFLKLFVPRYPEHHFINLDKLTYAANPLNLTDLETLSNYDFIQADITDYNHIKMLFERYNPGLVFHFAAESHVDRSIIGPKDFIETNINGTFNLLEACRQFWLNTNDQDISSRENEPKIFVHVSTDEVYGSLGPAGFFTEQTPYDPSSPYSASKAASDHLVRAYHRTYGLPAIITNCSNNYGPYQFPEKLIPLMILNALAEEQLPVYGKGENVRDWLYVEDHCRALWLAAEKGTPGQTYNIGGGAELKNIDVVKTICRLLSEETDRKPGSYDQLITFVADRPGHDLRYAIDSTRIKNELGWEPLVNFSDGLRRTIRWYLDNQSWVNSIQSGAYKSWLKTNYKERAQ